MKSVYDKLNAIRKPRVHITYDVETEGGSVQKELPFVVGVMGEFSGNASKVKRPLKERKFVQIDADNFDQVMQRMAPEVAIKVPNTLENDGSELAVNLRFNSMEDFSPVNIVNQIEPLKKLLEIRNQLNELLSKADISQDLEELLEEVLQNNEELQKLSKELNQTTVTEEKNDE